MARSHGDGMPTTVLTVVHEFRTLLFTINENPPHVKHVAGEVDPSISLIGGNAFGAMQ